MFKKVKKFFSNFWKVLATIAAAIIGIFLLVKRNEDKKVDELTDRIDDNTKKQEAIDRLINSNNNVIDNLEEEQKNIKKSISNIEEQGSEENIEDFFNKRGF